MEVTETGQVQDERGRSMSSEVIRSRPKTDVIALSPRRARPPLYRSSVVPKGPTPNRTAPGSVRRGWLARPIIRSRRLSPGSG
jgi:hypothetical protein